MSAEPVPTRLEGGIWRFQVSWCVLWAVIVLVLGAAVGIADHDWTGWVWGPAVALLLVAVAVRVFRTRYVGIDPEGLTVRSFWRTRGFSWDDVADVTLTSRSFLGPNYVPTLTLADGESCRVVSLVALQRPRAEERVTVLRQAKERFAATHRGPGNWPAQADHVPWRVAT
jgi:hypothetical protein